VGQGVVDDDFDTALGAAAGDDGADEDPPSSDRLQRAARSNR
jgi:hypothetical protein